MSLSNNANGAFKRYSTGPLYSERELQTVLTSLAAQGFVKVEDNTTLGMSIYNKTENGKKTADAVLYLDSVGCHPNNSGTMMISQEGKDIAVTTVWEYAKQIRIDNAKNPVTKLIARWF